MPEITPDPADPNRCLSVHWSLPVQCVLPRSHASNWHEARHPQTGERIRYRSDRNTCRTQEHDALDWRDLEIPPPGDVCDEPHSSKPGVYCQEPSSHHSTTWTHRATVDGCAYAWNDLFQAPTRDQGELDLLRMREIAVELFAEVERLEAELQKASGTRAEILHAVADMVDPSAPEVSWFGVYGPQVAAWLRMVADHSRPAEAESAEGA